MRLEDRSLAEFFREGIEKAQQHQKVELRETTQFYVVNLLSESSKGPIPDEPLALLYGRAQETANAAERYQLLKTIGDRSLYISGFFGDSLKRKIVDVDYYIAMGGNAYSCVSSIAREKSKGETFSELFFELAKKFTKLVELIAEISETSGICSDKDLLRLYERWLFTKNERLSEKLREAGIVPIDLEHGNLH